ncbi:hypothetical protein [Litorivivens sp.]|uniref:hypothetical protein n=1 Tax=Litorivivens sp. TaxID=2020868 RepID=UPI003561D54F
MSKELESIPLDKDEIIAIKALKTGTASEAQQQLALYVIVNKFARAHDLLYIPGDTHASAFLNGRAFVGAKILETLNIPVGRLEENRNAH